MDEGKLNKVESKETFRFGSGDVYKSSKCSLPITIKDKEGANVEKTVDTYIVDADVPFLIGLEELESLGAVIDVKEKLITFKEDGKSFPWRKTSSGHGVIDLEDRDNGVFVVENETDEYSEDSITKSGKKPKKEKSTTNKRSSKVKTLKKMI